MSLLMIVAICSAASSGALAAAVFVREPHRLSHRAFAVGMVLFGIEAILASLSADSLLPEEMLRWQRFRMVALSLLPGVWLLFSLSYSRGNSSEFLTRWWMGLVAAFVLPPALAILFNDRLVVGLRQIVSPYGDVIELGRPGFALLVCFLFGAVAILMNLERTFRAAVGTMRWRIKFMVFGLAALFGVKIFTSSQCLLFWGISRSPGAVDAAKLLCASGLIALSLRRSGHFMVDVYPSHAVLHSSLTVLLAGLYLVAVGLTARMVRMEGGETAFLLKSLGVLLGLLVLGVLLASEHVKHLAKRLVSRHFQRPVHDYRKIWTSLAARTGSLVSDGDLCREVTRLVSEIFEVLSVTIWLVDHERGRWFFGGSTSLPEARAGDLIREAEGAAWLVEALRGRDPPVELRKAKGSWAEFLDRCDLELLGAGGDKICVGRVSGDEPLGLMTLGERVGQVPFSVEEFDLLQCIGDQAAASLHNIQLARKVVRSREMGAFQTMSTFFVHDLKNTASTLSLLLENLKKHFGDPSFREDAYKAISKSISRIDQLITRLSLLRQDLELRPAEANLNELVQNVLNGIDWASNSRLHSELHPLPKVVLDVEQIQTVVTNLVTNAREAVSNGGEVQVETLKRNGWAVISVRDDGCGMSSEFIARSLFQPFRTTKKQGIGIGMFQSRAIVEAHSGSIEVESDLGKGTTIRVLLPLRGGRK